MHTTCLKHRICSAGDDFPTPPVPAAVLSLRTGPPTGSEVSESAAQRGLPVKKRRGRTVPLYTGGVPLCAASACIVGSVRYTPGSRTRQCASSVAQKAEQTLRRVSSLQTLESRSTRSIYLRDSFHRHFKIAVAAREAFRTDVPEHSSTTCQTQQWSSRYVHVPEVYITSLRFLRPSLRCYIDQRADSSLWKKLGT